MMKWASALVGVGLAATLCPPLWADELSTRAQAEDLVAQVAGALKLRRGITLKEINQQDRKWVQRDLYPMVYDLHGRVVAHGRNAKLVGHDLMGMKDADGRQFVRERVRLARDNPQFWQYYRFTDPLTQKVLPKETYCERHQGLIVCAGAYKRDGMS